MTADIRELVIKVVACLVGFFVVFALVGTNLCHYLFIWADSASNAAFSETLLWAFYVLFGICLGIIMVLFRPGPIESLIAGALMGADAGGLFTLGYTNLAMVGAIIVVVAIVTFFLRLHPARIAYISVSCGLCVSLALFMYSAASTSRVKDLSYTSITSDAITATNWSAMSSAQREGFVTGIIQKEVSRLSLDSVHAYQAILPKEVIATITPEGDVLVNYAVIRVASPSADKIASFEQENGVEWVYESLTSPDDLVEGVVHAMAHVYQTKRVAGEISEQRTWPYDDADDEDGNNESLKDWEQNLPVDPKNDEESYDNLLESQAWGYASNRLSAYVK